MRTVFEEEEEELAALDPHQGRRDDRDDRDDRELTISSTTLLAVFFGLVLICGLFFGLGYTLGRRAPSEVSQPQSAATSDSSAGSPQISASQPKPSAASQTIVPTPEAPETTDASGSTPAATDPQDDSAPDTAQPKAETKTPDPATPATQTVKPAMAPLTPQPAAAAPTGLVASGITGIMVQIAAISNPTDAGVLVGALQKHGYSVTSRHLPGDSFIHVQVGPFSNRADAIAMRQKLLGDGYNAILK
jgi:DedD protein